MTRNGSLDLLKLCLALMVVSIHANPFAPLGPVALAVTGDGIFRIAVPAFFVLNGYFLHSALRDGRAGAFIRRILTLYAIWMVIYLPLSLPDFIELSWLGDLRMLAFGFWHLWYLPALAIAAALLRLLAGWSNRRLLALAVGVFVAGALIPFGQAMGLWQIEDYLHRNGLFLGLPFLIVGLVIRRSKVADRAHFALWAGLAILSVMLVATESLSLMLAPQWSAHDNLFAIALAAPLVVIAVLAAPALRLPESAGTYANGLYFCHVGVLVVLQHLPVAALQGAGPLVWGLTVAGTLSVVAALRASGLARHVF